MSGVLRAALLVQPDRACAPGQLDIDADGRIVAAGPGVDDALGAGTGSAAANSMTDTWLTPGFVDLQVNGGFGIDLLTAAPGDLHRLARGLATTGVTAFLPTLISSPPELAAAQLARLAPALRAAPKGAAAPLGFHLEGPFLNPARAGAHARDALCAPDVVLMQRLLDAGDGLVRLVTLAPELPGALEVIDHLVARGVRVAIGHSEATFEQTLAAVDRGASLCTHLGNAMPALHQRAPGVAGACLVEDRLQATMIADLEHVHVGLLRLALRAKGAGGVLLVTDAVAALGEPDGASTLGDVEVRVERGVVRDAAGRLAGSATPFDEAARRLLRATDLGPIGFALVTATNAARAIGAGDELGSLEVGRRADVLEWDSSEDTLRLRRVLVRGDDVASERVTAR